MKMLREYIKVYWVLTEHKGLPHKTYFQRLITQGTESVHDIVQDMYDEATENDRIKDKAEAIANAIFRILRRLYEKTEDIETVKMYYDRFEQELKSHEGEKRGILESVLANLVEMVTKDPSLSAIRNPEKMGLVKEKNTSEIESNDRSVLGSIQAAKKALSKLKGGNTDHEKSDSGTSSSVSHYLENIERSIQNM